MTWKKRLRHDRLPGDEYTAEQMKAEPAFARLTVDGHRAAIMTIMVEVRGIDGVQYPYVSPEYQRRINAHQEAIWRKQKEGGG